MVKFFRKFVEYMAIFLLIGGMIIVLFMLGTKAKEKYFDKSSNAPTEEVARE